LVCEAPLLDAVVEPPAALVCDPPLPDGCDAVVDGGCEAPPNDPRLPPPLNPPAWAKAKAGAAEEPASAIASKRTVERLNME
jgi:hypothetical protein